MEELNLQTTFKYPLNQDSWGWEEKNAIAQVIKSGQYTMGEETRAFEERFASINNRRYAVMTNSGSSANLLMVAVYAKLFGHIKVIVPRVSWSTTYFPWMQHGIRMVFVDVDKTFNINPDIVAQYDQPHAHVVCAVNLLGNSCDFDRLPDDIVVDNCESLGAEYRDSSVGDRGLMSTNSFHFSHHIHTMEGGCVVTDEKEVYDNLVSIRAHGWNRGLTEVNYVHNRTGDIFEDSFVFANEGYCVRPTEISAATGREQLKKLDRFLYQRRQNADKFIELFGNCDWCSIQQITPNSKHSWFGFAIVLKHALNGKRKLVTNKLHLNGVECRPIVTGDFLKQPIAREWIENDLIDVHPYSRVTDQIHTNGFFIGNSHVYLSSQLERVWELIDEMR
jgi:CDP-6-deoxy-D-xylo-4-hexulose-3-dehydrase